jgi:hypothetical protein
LKYYPEAAFGCFSDIDGTIAFYFSVNELLEKDFTIFDAGCGRGVYGEDKIAFRRDLRIIKGKVAKVIGLDVDSEAGYNRSIDEFVKI